MRVRWPAPRRPASKRPPLLGRLRVGTKLMLLVLLPVGVLVGFMTITAVNDWDAASDLQAFQTATRHAFALAGVADQLAGERTAAVLLRLQPSPAHQAGLAAAQRRVDQALRRAGQQAGPGTGPVNVAGRLDAAGRQLGALRQQTSAGSLSTSQISHALRRDRHRPDQCRRRPAGSGADRDLRPGRRRLPGHPAGGRGRPAGTGGRRHGAGRARGTPSRWPPRSGPPWRARSSARSAAPRPGRPARGPGGSAVRRRRDHRAAGARRVHATSPAAVHTSGVDLADRSGTRIAGLAHCSGARPRSLAGTAADGLAAARRGGIRDAGPVAGRAAGRGRPRARAAPVHHRPLREVSAGARTLSSGDLDFDVSYAGRDEIGDVAAAFRDLRVTAERLAAEIRATTAAIGENRLEHRADVSRFEGTWAQLLAGMNETTAAFARLHRRRQRAERELAGIFNLSLDLLCIAGTRMATSSG